MPADLTGQLSAALAARRSLLEQLHAEQTSAYRLFHGSVEGDTGLTVDRYGDSLLVQSFHRLLEPAELTELETFYASALPGLPVFYNDRSQSNSRISNALRAEQIAAAHEPRQFQEMGVNYRFQARHAGQDPWLFLDLRAGRRRVMQEIAGKSLLNLFAYTCGVGIAAAKAGASHVVNIDFADSCIALGKENARLNTLPIRVRFVKSDIFPALRQFSGQGQATMVRGKRMPPFPKLEPHQFDMVFLDPPRYAKSPFGVVDLINDYAALFKPALMCTAEGGTLICCNNVAEVPRETWLDLLERSARKAGRAIREIEWIEPEADFPNTSGQSPLKMVLLRV
jgi:23S rRNA (cytosine1962-C5)-methyltransferase